MMDSNEELANKLISRATHMLMETRMKFMASCAAEGVPIVGAMYAWKMGEVAIGIDNVNKEFVIIGNLTRGIPIDMTMAGALSPEDLEASSKRFQELMWMWKNDPENHTEDS